jgi:hypothetical protein
VAGRERSLPLPVKKVTSSMCSDGRELPSQKSLLKNPMLLHCTVCEGVGVRSALQSVAIQLTTTSVTSQLVDLHTLTYPSSDTLSTS